MFKIQIEKDSIQMSTEFFTDLLKQLNVSYSVKKNKITIKTPEEVADEGVPIPLELEDSALLHLMLMAHERNISFNDFCNQVLREKMNELEKTKTTKKTKKNPK